MRAKASEMASKDCVKVAVRVRPFNKRERDAGSRCIISMTSNSISIQDPRNSQNSRTFTFDYTYWSHSGFSRNKDGLFVPEETGGRYADQASVFLDLGQGILDNALQGYNATLLAYGQTGSGKSYSMVGYGPNKGLIPTLCQRLFQSIRSMQDSRQCQVFFSMLEIYNEQVVDLLSKSSRSAGGLRVREDQQTGFYVEGLRRVPCDSALQVEQLMEQGTRTRTTAATHINNSSSRSHMLIIVQLKQIFSKECITKQSNIYLVDLAGSERQRSSGSEGDRLKEGTAINLSLTTLGNVISALADMALGKKIYIPYRDSVLTKLLQSALGGNSRTVMIATLSPADICYEESLSTLRYAERAKKIQNKAVVNESPTERLVKELKAENAKLLLRLSRLGQEGRKAEDESKELRRLLTHNELQIRAIQTLWEQHLQEALKDWETQYATITQERRMMQMYPYIMNVNEDAQLSSVVKLFIQEGEWDIGLADNSPRALSIRGLGIQEKHAVFSNQQRRVSITPVSGAKVIVNGLQVSKRTELQHLDRLVLGSNSTYLFIGFPSERSAEDWSRYDYDYFQSELAAAEGFHIQSLCDDQGHRPHQPDPSLLAVFYDYIKLMPMVTEANQMSAELKKGVEFKLEIKNLAMSDSKGHDLEKDIAVKVTSVESKQVWMWSKAKFINRKFLMEEVYQQQVAGGEGADRAPLPRDRDPFWDPLEPLHLGSAHLWLQSLAFRIPLEEQVEMVGPEGTEEAILQAQLVPCSPAGLALGEDDILIDPSELLGKRLDFQLVLDQCCGLRWVKEARNRGVQIGFQVFDCPQPLYTPAVWHNVNPLLDHRVQFTALRTSQDLLNYLQSNALVLELWGLQEGCSELLSNMDGMKMTQEDSVIIDKISASEHLTAETGSSDLSSSLRALHQDLDKLRNANAALKKENSALREQLNSSRNGVENNRGRQERRGSLRPSCDAEFAKALKVFYHSMTSVRGQLQRLRRHKPSEEEDLLGLRLFVDEHTFLLKDFSEQLEQCVSTLKHDVAAIVRRKREKSGVWS
ncbi:kinesin-like protein KIF28P isoform X2 [Danio rerio]|uniref:Kinesin-like protein 6 n=1 Tax=Danio rerio TaxID=7955 RepID=A0A8M9PEJ5_DANRE|nr:kinesin-like protein KIF28P [Danio rerio]|eukprot:XP_021322979.1 kinesin-like protein KIF28P [Danio rerio]